MNRTLGGKGAPKSTLDGTSGEPEKKPIESCLVGSFNFSKGFFTDGIKKSLSNNGITINEADLSLKEIEKIFDIDAKLEKISKLFKDNLTIPKESSTIIKTKREGH